MSDVEEWPAVDVRAFESSSSLAYEVGSWLNERNSQEMNRAGKINKCVSYVSLEFHLARHASSSISFLAAKMLVQIDSTLAMVIDRVYCISSFAPLGTTRERECERETLNVH